MTDLSSLLRRDVDLVFVVPRGIERDTVREMILSGTKLDEYLIVSDDELEVPNQLTLAEEPSLEIMQPNMLIDSNTPYFPAYNFEETRNIFLLSYGVESRITSGIENLFLQAEWVAVSGGNTIRMESVVVEMSERQAANYRIARRKERIALGETPSPEKNPRPPTQQESYEASISLRSLQAGNFVYPEDQQVELRKPREQRGYVPIDALEKRGGWITPDMRSQLSEFSPKFEAILNHIDPESKTIIWTRFKERYGAYGLEDWLKLDYPEMDLRVVTGDVKPMQRKKIYDDFSEQESGIMVTTVIPTDVITDVSHLFIVEGTKQDVVDQLVEKIKGGKNGLTITFFISNRSRDRSFYAPFEKLNKEKMSTFDQVLDRCQYSLSLKGKVTEKK